jgi:hypothetical protein
MKTPFRAALSALLAACLCAPPVAAQIAPPNVTGLPSVSAPAADDFVEVIGSGGRRAVPAGAFGGSGGGLSASAVSALPASSALTGTEAAPCVQGATLTQCTPAKQSAYTLGTGLAALPAASALTGAEASNLIQGGSPAKATVAQVGAYTLTTGVSGATAASSVAGTESIPAVTAGGAQVKITPSQIASLAGSGTSGKAALVEVQRSLIGGTAGGNTGSSQVINVTSDSTGVQDIVTRWPFMAAYALGLKAPNARVEFYQSNGSVANGASIQYGYLFYKTLLIQPGSAGERGIQFGPAVAATGNNLAQVQRSRFIGSANVIPATSSDLQILLRFAPAFDTNTPPATAGAIEAQYGAASTDRTQMVRQLVSGNIELTFSSSSPAANYTAQWTQAQLGYVIGQPIEVMFTVLGNNGSSGNTVCAYVISGRYQPVATAGNVGNNILSKGSCIAPTTSTFPASTVAYAGSAAVDRGMEIGARGGLTDPWQGIIYKAWVFDGIDGPLINSPNIDEFGLATGNVASQTVGSPTLYWFNGATAGKNFSWFTGSGTGTSVGTYTGSTARITVPAANLSIISTGHNEANLSGASLNTAYNTWVTQVLARAPSTEIYQMIQNPELDIGTDVASGSVSTQYAVASLHAARQRQMAAYTQQHGWVFTDVMSAFHNNSAWNPTGNSLMSSQTPAVHPSNAASSATTGVNLSAWPGTGYYLWAQTVAADFGAAGVLP